MILIEGAFSVCEYKKEKNAVIFYDKGKKESQIEAMKALFVRALSDLEIAFELIDGGLRFERIEENIDAVLDKVGGYFLAI